MLTRSVSLKMKGREWKAEANLAQRIKCFLCEHRAGSCDVGLKDQSNLWEGQLTLVLLVC